MFLIRAAFASCQPIVPVTACADLPVVAVMYPVVPDYTSIVGKAVA